MGRSHFPDNGIRQRATPVSRGVAEIGRHEAVETFAPEGRTPYGHYKNGHASATPATDGQRVYVSFGTRVLLALDMNGKQVWYRDLGPMDAYRHCRITVALQRSPHPVPGSVAQLVHRGVRYTDWKDTLDNAARGGRGLGHADRGSRRRS